MEQEQKKKSKVELIKSSSKGATKPQNSPKPGAGQATKKKVVLKRKSPHSANSAGKKKTYESPAKKANAAANATQNKNSTKTGSGPAKKKNLATKQGIVGGKYIGPRSGRGSGQYSPTHKSYRSNKNTSNDKTSNYRQGGWRGGQGRPAPYGQRPGQGGGSRNFAGTGGTSTTPNESKSVGKRFFKAKRPDNNYKRRDKHQEREFQFKKKNIERINPVPKTIDIMEAVAVSELARKMNLKASDLIAKLMGMGMMVTINQQIDAETASILASEYECEVKIVSLYDETLIETEADDHASLKPRPPIVTVMGHVDHGKTKLLDSIRSSNVLEGESGGITQHIGAYQVDVSGNKITFLDTPGHEAFTLMRSRGAQMTDIVILVVAANDGVMPQTIEAIHHAQDAKVPIIVAVNKVDLPEANVEKVKQQLAEHKLLAEDWGGESMFYEVSALKGEGITELLEGIVLQSDVLELKANYDTWAEGRVIESKIDPGRGTVATVLIERGSMRIGENFLSGVYPGRIRAMYNDRGEAVTQATPSMPVEITGLTGVPNAGDPFQITANEKQARQVGDKRQELKKLESAKNVKKITLHNLYDSIQEGAVQDVKIIIKGDVQGSVEAIQGSLEKLSTQEIKINVIHAGVGAINDSDINLAAVSDAIIIGFHVRPTSRAQITADREKVEIRKYSIIYDVIEDIKSAMEGMLSPELKEEHIGTAEVRDTFKVPKIGLIAGSYITNGMVRRNSSVRVYREGEEIFSGTMNSLKRFKDDAKEVAQGYECGIGFKDFSDIKVGDIIEVFEVKEVARKLGKTLVELEQERIASEKASAGKTSTGKTSTREPSAGEPPVGKTSTGKTSTKETKQDSQNT